MIYFMANAKSWRLGRTEYGTSYGVGTSKKLLAYVPKIMTLIKMGDNPKTSKEILRKSCIINAKACKPVIATSIDTLNYMTIPCDTQINGANIAKGAKIQLQVTNGSPDQIVVVPNNS